jgi:hypothetical protein
VAVCPDLAATPLGLCSGHESRYRRRGRPGGAALPQAWSRSYERQDLPVPVSHRDEEQFHAASGSSAEAYWQEFCNAVLGHPSDLWNSFMSKPGTTPVEMEL